jgi:S1-C subfamily serine protease
MPSSNHFPVSAPMRSDSAGAGSTVAMGGVLRVICVRTGSSGTGFLHSSGNLITAEHVVRGAAPQEIFLAHSSGFQTNCSLVETDEVLDLALLKPVNVIQSSPLQICSANSFSIGDQVSTWGFPYGYSGTAPLLTVGYLSGVEDMKGVSRWVINAAFNSGNSGGPVLRIEDGTVIGVVSSKLAPLPPSIESVLEALANQQSGFLYTAVDAKGASFSLTEGQIVHSVLQFLRSQTQLVIGHSVILRSLREFLGRYGIAS